jgi:N-methylhydantoinase B
VSLAAAEADYGVVIRAGEIDETATAAKRGDMRVQQPVAHFHFGPEREAFEAVWTRENYAELTVILASLPVHWRFFAKTKIFEKMPAARSVLDAFALVRAAYPQIPD